MSDAYYVPIDRKPWRRLLLLGGVLAAAVALTSALMLGLGNDAAQSAVPAGTGLEVIDADDDRVVGSVVDGSSLSADALPGSVALSLIGTPRGTESVRLNLDGPVAFRRLENVAPYSLFGDRSGDHEGRALPPGDYTVSARAYAEDRGRGDLLGSTTFTFTVTSGEAPTPPPLPIPTPAPPTIAAPPMTVAEPTTTAKPTTNQAPTTTAKPATNQAPTTTEAPTPAAKPALGVTCPGSTDLVECVRDAGRNGGGTIVLAAQTYTVTETVILESNVTIKGQGSSTVITFDRSVAGRIDEPLLHRGRRGGSLQNVSIEDVYLRCTVDVNDRGDRGRTHQMALFIDGGGDQDDPRSLQHKNITLKNVEVSHCGGTGIHIKGTDGVTATDLDLHDNGWGTTDLWHNIYLRRVANVVMIQTSANSGGFYDSPSGHGMRMGDLNDVYFQGLHIYDNADHGLHINDVKDLRAHNLTVRDNCADSRGSCKPTACYGSCDVDLRAGRE